MTNPTTALRTGDYVMASKYHDGDPSDHWCVGYYQGVYHHCGFQLRHIVVDKDGKPFRANGFRRCERIGTNRGNWIVRHMPMIERQTRFNVWHYHRAPWRDLEAISDVR